ncbi:AMP-binding protein [Rhizobium leguminosarum bv. viciae]|nr:AMP-binding protein [Rhizobium leguminosarum bv. viciae]
MANTMVVTTPSSPALWNVFAALKPTHLNPDAAFIRQRSGEILSYADMLRRTEMFAGALKAEGIGKGDVVAVLLEKSPEGLMLYLALARIGAVFLPVHSGLTDTEITYVFRDAQPKLSVCDPRFEALVSPLLVQAPLTLDATGRGSLIDAVDAATPCSTLAVCAETDPNALVYTSGTTGKPKGAWIGCGQVVWNVSTIRAVWEIRPNDVLLHLNLMAFGIFATLLPIYTAGASIMFLSGSDIDGILDAIPRATMLATVPTVYKRLLDSPDFTPERICNMRLFITGSAPMRSELFDAFRERTGHAPLDRYGMTEALLIASNRAGEARVSENSGYPLPGSEIRLVGEDGKPAPEGQAGMIQVRQPMPFRQYLNAPEKTAASFTPDGWLITGDFGRMDNAGRLTVLGRGSELIVSGGLNVYPREVEELVNALPGVIETAVIGLPHPEYGEAVTAVIETAEPQLLPEPGEMRRLLRQSLAGYKVPKHFEIVEKFPRNALGKIKKNELRERYRAHFENI